MDDGTVRSEPCLSGSQISISKREQWKSRFDFLFACVGLSVGLGNVWRFPYLCYKNGGGTFLIPYFISVFAAGIPLFTLEVTLGQLTAQGGIIAWDICPLFRGIGFATLVTIFCLNCYYNVILAWGLYYLFSSFTATLPWTLCGQWWNTDKCDSFSSINGTNGSAKAYNSSNVIDSAVEFWENRVLGLSTGIENMGRIQWHLALCLLLAWVIVFLCVFRGIKASGKVVYFTATAPYLFMFILLGRAVTLEGAVDGLRHFISADWEKLMDFSVWIDAGSQIFFSYSISLGTLAALGSYNEFHHNFLSDCVAFASINTFTSLLAGLIVFGTLGHMATVAGVPIDDVADSGPGLAFVVYPRVLGILPGSPFWSVCFFLMILLLGIDSQFTGVEGMVTAISDFFPSLALRPLRRTAFAASSCVVCYLVGLPMVTEGGMYLFQLFNHYAGSLIIMLTAFFECVVVGYFYGGRKISRNMKLMLGFSMGPIPIIFWCVLTPIFTLSVFVLSVVVYEELTYERAAKTVVYKYPDWAVQVGWLIASCSVFMIPIVMVIQILRTPGSLFERIRTLCRPRMCEERTLLLETQDIAQSDKEYYISDRREDQLGNSHGGKFAEVMRHSMNGES